MSDNIKQPVVIALGYFDSVHLGHKEVIGKAKEFAERNGAKLVVFTFKGNLKAMLNASEEKTVYLPQEREVFIKELGADELYCAPVDFNFLSIGKLAFLNKLNKKYDIKAYVCGKDYRFGKFGKGTVGDLENYAKEHGQTLIIVDDFMFDGAKVSTTAVKKCLAAGDIEKANVLLGRKYSIAGRVFRDRKIGSDLGFPTVNIRIDKDKFRIKDGVYAGRVKVGGTDYRTVINYGARPTFDLSEKLIEAHIIGFSGDLYGQELTLRFDKRVRDVKKFSNEDALKEQIEIDVAEIKDGRYD